MSIKLSVVFFTYNRSGYLAHAVSQFIKNCTMKRDDYEIIISDDGSEQIHQKKLCMLCNEFGISKLLLNEHKGMGNNFNAGIKAANGDYILHLEDDWELQDDLGHTIISSIHFLEKHEEVDMVRLSPLQKMDPEKVLTPFSTNIEESDYKKIQNTKETYSNNPHIKRQQFHDINAYYKENCSPSESELAFCDFSYNKNASSTFAVKWL
jgi:glycosyltransferase involved in cell wall biosynthesis